ncbi:hypothetical protein BH18CHL2_BH18CHL2_00050 [soil metagenome]
MAEELRRLAANLAETTVAGTPAQDTAARLAHAAIDASALAGPALEGDDALLDREAFRLNVDATSLRELVQLAVQPVLWEAAGQAAALTDIDRCERGYCLLCGSWPVLAELVGSERRRVLRCVRCGSAWSWLVLLCPYCGTDDHRELGVLQLHDEREERASSRGGGERVDTCARCRGYVKGLGTFSSHSAVRLIAEDVSTLPLDAMAVAAGYRRPGDVAAATAGIPRLVREGRTVG